MEKLATLLNSKKTLRNSKSYKTLPRVIGNSYNKLSQVIKGLYQIRKVVTKYLIEVTNPFVSNCA